MYIHVGYIELLYVDLDINWLFKLLIKMLKLSKNNIVSHFNILKLNIILIVL